MQVIKIFNLGILERKLNFNRESIVCAFTKIIYNEILLDLALISLSF